MKSLIYNILGSLERFIGDLIDKWGILRYKYRDHWEDISDIIKNCMALQNINTHEHITREYVHEVSVFDWDDMLQNCNHWFGTEIVPIYNQVSLNLNLN